MATPIPENRASFTVTEVSALTGGALHAPPGFLHDARASSVGTDTRALTHDAVFVALVGERFDGHTMLEKARDAGALVAVVREGSEGVEGLARVAVPDTLVALGDLARGHARRVRAQTQAPCIAVGGAAGKTTTKELCAALLRAVCGETLATRGNLNNRVGAPMTLFTLTEAHRAMVIEVGTNTRGEIDALGRVVEPDVALVLNAEVEHTEGLGTLDDVKDEESALFLHAKRAAVTLASDEGLVARMRAACAKKPNLRGRTFAMHAPDAHDERAKPDAWLASRALRRDGSSELAIALDPALVAPDTEPVVRAVFPLLGAAAALDAVAAVLCVLSALETRANEATLRALGDALATMQPAPGRMVPRMLHGALVLDDTYNANPGSLRAALETSRELAVNLGARRVLVLGDMLELGSLSEAMHAEVLTEALASGPAVLLAVGPECTRAARALADDFQRVHVQVAADAREAAEALVQPGMVREGDVVLVKGSRGIALERAIEALAARGSRASQ